MLTNFAILDLSTPDLLIILAIVTLLFGAKKLPELSKSIGQSARELRNGLNGDDTEPVAATPEAPVVQNIQSSPVAPARPMQQVQAVRRPIINQ